ncbi:hypothetical protein [Pseudomonas aeruginosa]|uniref:hypothetical protein n=1 Tax=Pseudomonas aeruginosa TaxID=287 RepID=UPI000F524108|nr:hypothetical protein [Pseudomonas aeruginosa]MBX5514175.1 hypothetical protein [Pseudomonas aeruginosa]MBX5538195.1 hypothetical protein [Pseudomonas aeruginosa]MBX6002700.1 hypothetical protein [Pseudomonas aeruginosa]MCT4894409.1 hypothetical protein [Pseudomonas aeruginosa]MCT5606232.1 hypothetical protein [Pseudomonas aeruginosa]
MGGSMTIHGAGFSARSGTGNNDKTTVAGKGILLAMCHPHAGARYLFGIHHLATWRFRVHLNPRLDADWQQAAKSGRCWLDRN